MPRCALLFGSIGTLVETSDIQRRAYNRALQEAGLDWHWDVATYRELLTQSGGQERLALLGRATGQPLDDATIKRIHARKTALACAEIAQQKPPLRPGVAALMQLAAGRGWRRAFVTSTERANIDAIMSVDPAIGPDQFDAVLGRADATQGKPHPDVYRLALERTGISAQDAIVVEDTATSLMASVRAGITTVAVPGAFADVQDFWQADLVLPALADADGALDPRLLALIDS